VGVSAETHRHDNSNEREVLDIGKLPFIKYNQKCWNNP